MLKSEIVTRLLAAKPHEKVTVPDKDFPIFNTNLTSG
jgi:hypothetical protein